MSYDVYGLGNALLDVQCEVDEQFLNQHNIPKGLMTLVEYERQSEILELLGEDRIHKVSSGGSLANSMMVLQYFGGKGFYSCNIAQDEAGDQYYKEMKEAGLDTNFDTQERGPGNTGRCLVKITPDADRTMSTYLGVSIELCEERLNHEALKKSKYLYLEGYLTASEPAHKAAVKAKSIATQYGVKTALTLSDPSIVTGFKDQFHELLNDPVDLLFCNEDEAKEFTGTDTLEQAVEALKQYAKTFAVTIGPKGSLLFDGQQFISVPATEEKPIDTVGAGDMFAGAFLYALTKGMSWRKAGELANLTSSKVVTIYGPRVSKKHTEELLVALDEMYSAQVA
ncbi:MAG: adenosine kinase [Coxiella sp. (in: Bacteria)]|nr:MAG: adenosine kinase [Coxiella sp. (in: g-proteobacteria)]